MIIKGGCVVWKIRKENLGVCPISLIKINLWDGWAEKWFIYLFIQAEFFFDNNLGKTPDKISINKKKSLVGNLYTKRNSAKKGSLPTWLYEVQT